MALFRHFWWSCLIWLAVLGILFPSAQCQEKSVHVEEDLETLERIDDVLIDTRQDEQKIAAYLDILRESPDNPMMRLRPLSLEEMQVIREIIQLFDEKKFSFQMVSPSPTGDGYLMEIVDRFPGQFISFDEINKLHSAFEMGGWIDVWKRFHQLYSPGHYISISEYLQRLLAKLPGKSIHSPLISDSEKAKQLLWENDDPQYLLQLVARYPGWEKRDQALDMLGNFYFLRGEMDLAIGIWMRKLFLYPHSQTPSSLQTLAQVATAAFISGDTALYEKIMKDNAMEMSPVTFEGKTIPCKEYLASIPQRFSSAVFQNSLAYRGNGSHNAIPPSINYKTASILNIQEKVLSPFSSYADKPTYDTVPIIVGSDIYINGKFTMGNSGSTKRPYFRDQVSCFSLQPRLKSIRLRWSRPYTGPSYSIRSDSSSYSTATFANNCLFFFGSRLGRRNNYRNTIYAVDQKDGSIVWTWPPPSEQSEMIDVQFQFAPVVVGNKLLASATIVTGATRAEVFCFDIGDSLANSTRRSPEPKLLWRKFVSSAYQRSWDGSQLPSTDGQGLASGYGLVYYCTNLGAVAALDIHTGEIRWLNKYNEHTPRKYRLDRQKGNRHWYGQPPVVKNGKLYITPEDSGKLYIYDCFSGALQRTFPEEGSAQDASNSMRGVDRLLGVDAQGVVYLAGPKNRNSTQILALRPEGDEEITWRQEIKGNMFGSGLLTEKWIYLTTRRGVFQIDKRNGQTQEIVGIYARKRVPHRPGKMTIHFQPSSLMTTQIEDKQYLVMVGESIAVVESSQ